MNTINRFFIALAMLLVFTCNVIAQDPYEKENKAEKWYADLCAEAISLFGNICSNYDSHPQKYALIPNDKATPLGYALVVSTQDEREMVMILPNGNKLKAERIDKDNLPQEKYWRSISDIGRYRTYSKDITLRERPLPVRDMNKAKNYFVAVVDSSDRISDIKAYNQMIFKPHKNGVRFVGEHEKKKVNEEGIAIIHEFEYTFKLNTPSVVSKMFRGYSDYEACPWVVKNSFFNHHNILQYSRWKEGEPIKKASADACRIISEFYGGRRIVDSRWVATLESGERSFYAVQFEHQGADALAALVCIGEGAVTSVWEFHGDVNPDNYSPGQAIWFVDDEGNFMEHVPEIHCIVSTDEGLELYVRQHGGESVQYSILREMGPVWMTLMTDYYIYVWE